MQATQTLVDKLTIEHYVCIALVSASILVCLVSAAKLLLVAEMAATQQITTTSLFLGSLGSSAWVCSKLM
jgi:hypothetical protein